MTDHNPDTLERLATAAEQIATAAEQIATAAEQIATAAEQIATALDAIAGLMAAPAAVKGTGADPLAVRAPAIFGQPQPRYTLASNGRDVIDHGPEGTRDNLWEFSK